MMMQPPSSMLETSAGTKRKRATERARADIRAVITQRRKRIRETADRGEPPYLDVSAALPAIAEASGLSQGEVNQLAGYEIAAELRLEFEVDNPRLPLPPNPGGARTAANYRRVNQDVAHDRESGLDGPEAQAGLDDPEPES